MLSDIYHKEMSLCKEKQIMWLDDCPQGIPGQFKSDRKKYK